MKIIFSRKGFDSSYGGTPSPIFPDNRIVSIPIPDKDSPIKYENIKWQEFNLGYIVSLLTKNRIPSYYGAHIDPDLDNNSLPRVKGWRPVFGQMGQAQGHLRNENIKPGDIFLFFGLFRRINFFSKEIRWDRKSRPMYVLWGWLQIDSILDVNEDVHKNIEKYLWLKYHPHLHKKKVKSNTLYIARKHLSFPNLEDKKYPGAGTFLHLSNHLILSDPLAERPTIWKLPLWFYPRNGKVPLTYHSKLDRWQKTKDGTKLEIVKRGQEFVLNTDDFPEAIEWIRNILKRA